MKPRGSSQAAGKTKSPSESRPQEYSKAGVTTVVVGQDEVKFTIHTDLLRNYSRFFRASLSGNYLETRLGMVRLPDDNPKEFGIIVDWLYKEDPLRDPHNGSNDFIETLIRTYFLADKLVMSMCKNNIMDDIREYYHKHPVNAETMKLIDLCDLPSQSAIRQFFVQQYAFDIAASPLIYKNGAEVPALLEFKHTDLATAVLKEVIQIIANHVDSDNNSGKKHVDPAKRTGCVYHDHTGEHTTCL